MAGPATFAAEQPTTLSRLCADHGPDLVEITIAPRGLEAPVAGVWLHDPLDPPPAAGGALLLLVGASPAEAGMALALRDLAATGASAVACRAVGAWSHQALQAAEETGLALLTVPPHVGWGEL